MRTASAYLLVSLAASACGRIRFDDNTARSDDARSDGAGNGGGDGGGDGAVDSSLLAWYPMDDDPALGATDASGHGRHMACGANGCPTATAGRVGGAFAFTSGQSLRLPNDSAFTALGAFTVAMWMRVTSASAAGYSGFAKTVGPNVENSWDLGTYSSNVPSLCTSGDGNSNSCDLTAAAAPVNAWFHIAGSWDGTTKRVYLDGVVSSAGPRAVIFDTHDVTIGCDNENGPLDWCLEGAIDDARLYNRALSDAEVMALAGM